MKKNLIIFFIFVIIVLVTFSFIKREKNKEIGLDSIRIGWQTAWAPQAQLVQVLKHTDILEKNGLFGEFKGFSYGGPLNEAALAGEVDIIFTADFPAINLLSKSDNWVIVSRLIDFRGGIIVPKDSSFQVISDLKGKVISSPFGSAIHLYALSYIKDQGFDVKKEFKIEHLDFGEQLSVVQKGTSESFGNISAFISADPPMALGEADGKIRILKPLSPQSFVVMSTNFINQNPKAAEKFIRSFIESYYYYSKNQSLANEWFRQEAKKDLSDAILNQTSSLEKNLQVGNIKDIDVSINEERVVQLDKIINEAVENDLLKQTFDIRKRIDLKIIKEAKKNNLEFDLDQVKVK